MIRRNLLALLLCLFPLAALAQPMLPGTPKEGVDYVTLPAPLPTFAPGKIEIAEVFSYGCVHCAEFQPFVNTWKKTMAKDVRWEYVPGAFGGHWDRFARAYFAAQILGVQEKTHDAVFKGIFVDRVVKTASAEELADLYARLGVDRAKFLATMSSEAVTTKLAKSRDFAQRTGVDSTPTLIVNGKYRVTGKSFEDNLRIATQLVAQERAAQPTGQGQAAAQP